MHPIEKVIGKIPTAATHWKCHLAIAAKDGGKEKWAVLRAQSSEDADAKVSTWPLASLSLEGIQHAWGPGLFRLTYFGDNGKGGLIKVGNSRDFELTDVRTADPGASTPAEAPPPPPPAPAPTPAAEALTMIQVASMLAKDQIAMIQLLSSQANQQQAAMAAQQVAFLQEHAKISHQQMSQHYSAMLKASRTGDGPILAAVQQLGQRIDAIEEYEDEPPPPPALPVAGGAFTDGDGRFSPGKALEAAKEHGPAVVELVRAIMRPPEQAKAAE